MKAEHETGHLTALLTIVIWATTFISTKVLLRSFQPVEILFYRFAMGFAALCLICPHRLRLLKRSQEMYFAAAGLCGICIYYLLENTALTYTQASNVGVIISTAPFFTAILTRLIWKKEKKLSFCFFGGFALAMTGIFLISFQGKALKLNPCGDLLALAASVIWACYSVLTRKIGSFGYHTIQATRRVFAYGLIFMVPLLLVYDFQWDVGRFYDPINVFNMVFLGLGASALCFVTWNYSVKVLGAVRTSIYIYLVPVITVAASVLILHEKVTWQIVSGIALTVGGLFVSEVKPRKADKG